MADTATADPLVVVQNVQKHYGDFQALSDIDLTVHKGEVVVVIGPSGSGRRKLTWLLANIVSPPRW